MVWRAYYSEKMAKRGGTVNYKGKDGKLVECTCVSGLKSGHGTKWDDIHFVGIVTEFVNRNGWGKLGSPPPIDWRHQ